LSAAMIFNTLRFNYVEEEAFLQGDTGTTH
jgi:hypothetical protein